ncbi:MAG: carbon-phosphorus lyase complex subunit PhnI [Desulfovibrio sp.]|nr:carbon-phosphorus lyase complex subunit PhnI [Desulfovibrio sp.]MDY5485467.1 carbon-phosphorus lyase complex subunit PhnI [Desulfovibrio sp.]MEE0405046.1 carbon-phosphorus lyase complex subunit PhnI [Desulfovibrio sp.]
MYVAVKGGEKAIAEAHRLLAEERRGDVSVPELSLSQIKNQMRLAVARVMSEGSLYSEDLAAIAIKQAQGDLQEAVFLLRAYRTTLPRFGVSDPMDTSEMILDRRISATWKDLPGGQVLGATYDYTHRLLDLSLAGEGGAKAQDELLPDEAAENTPFSGDAEPDGRDGMLAGHMPRAMAVLAGEGLLEPVADSCTEDSDITRHPLELPCDRPEDRSVRLQVLARADEGFLLSMAYSVQRGANHPFVGELRRGTAELSFTPEELGFSVTIGEIEITECEIVGQYVGTAMEPCFARGYGLVFGNNERKVLSMAIVDRALRARELEERIVVPSQIPEFVLLHSDSVEASGFVQHIKLPHYVDFQAQLSLIRGLRAKSGKKEENQE